MRDSTALSPLPRTLLPPRISGLPLLGNLPGLLSHPLEFLEQARRRHGDIFRVRLGTSEAIALCHPRHAQHVLVDHGRNYTKGGPFWDSLRTFMGNGLPVSDGESWRRQRRMLQPAFHHQRIVSLASRLVEALDESLAEHWEQAARTGEPFDVAQAFSHMSMRLLVRTMFGGGLSQSEARQAEQDLAYIIDFVVKGMVANALPSWLPVPGRERYRATIQAVDALIFRMLERDQHEAGSGDTLLSLLSAATDAETGERMPIQQIRDEAVALFVAGYETVSATLTWTLHALTRQPELGERLQAEVDAVLGSRAPAFSDLKQLTYTYCLLHETLRLYPPVYWIPRTPVEDDELDGYRIPSGMLVGVMSMLIHRHPEVWESPERFDPDRFLPERSEGRPRQAWLAFGSGQRQCIGKEFALMEVQLVLARLAQRFRITAVPGQETRLRFSTTLAHRDGLWVRLSPR